MQILVEHFNIPLSLHSFMGKEKKLMNELKLLKRITPHYYNDVPAPTLWKNVLRWRRHELPNLCMLVEIILAIAVSNGFVESTFSFLTAMLSDRCLSLNHDTMEDLLLIRANHLIWSAAERDAFIETAVNSFLQTRRKMKTDRGSGLCVASAVRDLDCDSSSTSGPPQKAAKLEPDMEDDSEDEQTDNSDDDIDSDDDDGSWDLALADEAEANLLTYNEDDE